MNKEEKRNVTYAALEYLINEFSIEWNNRYCYESDDIFTKITKVALGHGISEVDLAYSISELVDRIGHTTDQDIIIPKLNSLITIEAGKLKFDTFDDFEDAVDRAGIYASSHKLKFLLGAAPIPSRQAEHEFLELVHNQSNLTFQ